MNVFIVKLRHTGYGCNVCGQFVGCILHADDIIILSASVHGLQNMLDCCFEVSCDPCLTFNCAKSSGFAIGMGNKLRISDMNLGPNSIEWCDSFTFQAGVKLKINIDMIKQKFLWRQTVCWVILTH